MFVGVVEDPKGRRARGEPREVRQRPVPARADFVRRHVVPAGVDAPRAPRAGEFRGRDRDADQSDVAALPARIQRASGISRC